MCRAPAVHAAGPSRTHATLARLAAAAPQGLRRGAAPTRGRAGAAPPDAHPAAALGTICTHGAPAHAAGAAYARPRAAVGVGPAALGRRVAAPRDAAAAARTIHSAAAVAGLAAVERTAREQQTLSVHLPWQQSSLLAHAVPLGLQQPEAPSVRQVRPPQQSTFAAQVPHRWGLHAHRPALHNVLQHSLFVRHDSPAGRQHLPKGPRACRGRRRSPHGACTGRPCRPARSAAASGASGSCASAASAGRTTSIPGGTSRGGATVSSPTSSPTVASRGLASVAMSAGGGAESVNGGPSEEVQPHPNAASVTAA